MLFALSAMDPNVQGVFFLIAVALFILGALSFVPKLNLVAAGLAFFAFVFMWNAFAAA
jgi:hypothetical protein